MTFVRDCGALGPAPDSHQVGVMTAFVVYGAPFLIIRAGRERADEIDKVQKARAAMAVGPEVLCFRAPELDGFIAESLDENGPSRFHAGEAVLFQPQLPIEAKSPLQILGLFFDELTSFDKETVLLPQFAALLAEFLADKTDWSAAPGNDKAGWERLKALRDAMDCTDELLDCAVHVRDIGYPVLLWHFPDHDWENGARLIAHKTEHWIVPPFATPAP